MKYINTTISALVLAASSVLAQAPTAPPAPTVPAPADKTPAAVEPPPPPITPPVAPTTPPAVVPSAIEPPVQNPGAAAPVPGVQPGVAVDPSVLGMSDPNARKAVEFTGDPIDLVLRTLARQARMNVVVSPAVQGTVNLRLENQTPREVIQVICQSNGLSMDELNGVYYIKTQAEKSKEPTEPYQHTFSYAQAKDIVTLLQAQLSSGLVPQVDARTNTIFYREGKSNSDKVKKFLESVDHPTRQVQIEARLIEVTANPKQSYGINWAGVVGGSATPQTFKYGGSSATEDGEPPTSIVVNPDTGKLQPADFFLNGHAKGAFGQLLAGQFAILSAPQLSATLRLLNEDSDAEFIANPRVVASNNQEATIKVTRLQPVPSLNFNEQTAQAVFGGFTDKEFGNTLTVLPTINKDNFVSMIVKPKISNKVGDATFTFSGATVASPIIDERTFSSNVLIRSGDTLAIGGLLQDEVTKGRTKVPVLGDVPLFGYLFQERLNSRTKRNLLVFVTPTIIKQGYGTGLENQITGLTNSGEEYADITGWRNNARGSVRIIPTSDRQLASEYPVPTQKYRSTKTTTRTTSYQK